MLKKFIVENFSSFQLENSLDLTAGQTEVNSNHVVKFNKVKILKSAILYGANASGKSNLIKAIDYASKIILMGLGNVDRYKKYFRLDNESLLKPTKFEFELEINSKFFTYGFSSILNNKEITEEWLYEIGKSTPEKIFERINNDISLGKSLGKSNKNKFEIYTDDMKNQSSQLFLSEIANKKLNVDDNPESKVINEIYNWFEKKLIILYPDTKFDRKSLIVSDDKLSITFQKYLNEFDTGINSIKYIEEDFESSLTDIPMAIKKQIEKDLLGKDIKDGRIVLEGDNGLLYVISKTDNELKVHKLGLLHGLNSKDIFDLKDESDGTRRLFDLIPLINKFSSDCTIIIDEFDRSLHPMLTKQFFELFYKLNSENSKTQLIITTHESTLLDLSLVRRDEIFFVEKNKEGASRIFSLNQFKVRYDSKIEKAYLLGRYGAIPIFKTFDEINLGN
jgi:AAA15 family ATPase/GTPase